MLAMISLLSLLTMLSLLTLLTPLNLPRLDKSARLSFSRSLDLLLNDIDQTNINRDIRDGKWLSTLLTIPLLTFLVFRALSEGGGGGGQKSATMDHKQGE